MQMYRPTTLHDPKKRLLNHVILWLGAFAWTSVALGVNVYRGETMSSICVPDRQGLLYLLIVPMTVCCAISTCCLIMVFVAIKEHVKYSRQHAATVCSTVCSLVCVCE